MVEKDVDTLFSGRPRHGLCDRPHSADCVPPRAGHARGFAEKVMEKHVGASRCVGRSEIADDPVEPEQRLDDVGFEIAVEDLTGASQSEIVDGPRFRERKAGHVLSEAQHFRKRAQLCSDIWRGTEQPLLEQSDDGIEIGDIAVVALRILLRVPRNLLAGQAVASRKQILALARKEIVCLAEDDLQPVPLQLEIPNDLRIEQADGVACRRVAEARQELISDGSAADSLRRL